MENYWVSDFREISPSIVYHYSVVPFTEWKKQQNKTSNQINKNEHKIQYYF